MNSSQLVILDYPDEVISSFFLKCKVKTTQSWGTECWGRGPNSPRSWRLHLSAWFSPRVQP